MYQVIKHVLADEADATCISLLYANQEEQVGSSTGGQCGAQCSHDAA